MPLGKQDAHGVGSGISYGKRYALSAAIGIVADEDDDGNAAVGRASAEAKPVPEPAGFREWADDLAAVADEGTAALQAAWSKSKLEYRQYITSTNKAALDALKAKAAKVKQPVTA
jgi:hypothetical protein